MFRPVRKVAAPVGRQATFFGQNRQVAPPGAKCAVSDCILLWREKVGCAAQTCSIISLCLTLNSISNTVLAPSHEGWKYVANHLTIFPPEHFDRNRNVAIGPTPKVFHLLNNTTVTISMQPSCRLAAFTEK